MSRRLLVAVLLAAAFAAGALPDAAAADAPAPIPKTVSQRLQAHFFSVVDGWRRNRSRYLDLSVGYPAEKTPEAVPILKRLVNDLRVVVVPTPIPMLRAQPRVDGNTLFVSAGWLNLVNELLWAEALDMPANLPGRLGAPSSPGACLKAYESELEKYIDAPKRVSVEAMPRVAAFFKERKYCAPPLADDPIRFARKRHIDEGFEAAVVQLMSLEMQIMVAAAQPEIDIAKSKAVMLAKERPATPAVEPTSDAAEPAPGPVGHSAKSNSLALAWLEAHDFGLKRPAGLAEARP